MTFVLGEVKVIYSAMGYQFKRKFPVSFESKICSSTQGVITIICLTRITKNFNKTAI